MLLAAGKSFKGYSEDLPGVGSQVCSYAKYARKHAPWTDFSKDVASDNQPFSNFPTGFFKLPTVAWVVPNLDNDMHDGSIQQGDRWLQTNLMPYVTWAQNNNSLLIVQFDEDDGKLRQSHRHDLCGPMVKPGKYGERIQSLQCAPHDRRHVRTGASGQDVDRNADYGRVEVGEIGEWPASSGCSISRLL